MKNDFFNRLQGDLGTIRSFARLGRARPPNDKRGQGHVDPTFFLCRGRQSRRSGRSVSAGRADWSREHGIPLSVIALYTDADAEAPFVRMASASICLGEPMVRGENGKRRSVYLDVERIVTLARQAGADAIWPGWGFASERPELPEACEAQGLVFLGPPASAMRGAGRQDRRQAPGREGRSSGEPLVAGAGGRGRRAGMRRRGSVIRCCSRRPPAEAGAVSVASIARRNSWTRSTPRPTKRPRRSAIPRSSSKRS